MKINYRIKKQIHYKVSSHQSGFVIDLPDNSPESFKKLMDKLEALGFTGGPHYNPIIAALGGHLATNRIAWWVKDQDKNDGWVQLPYEQFITSRIAIKNLHR